MFHLHEDTRPGQASADEVRSTLLSSLQYDVVLTSGSQVLTPCLPHLHSGSCRLKQVGTRESIRNGPWLWPGRTHPNVLCSLPSRSSEQSIEIPTQPRLVFAARCRRRWLAPHARRRRRVVSGNVTSMQGEGLKVERRTGRFKSRAPHRRLAGLTTGRQGKRQTRCGGRGYRMPTCRDERALPCLRIRCGAACRPSIDRVALFTACPPPSWRRRRVLLHDAQRHVDQPNWPVPVLQLAAIVGSV